MKLGAWTIGGDGTRSELIFDPGEIEATSMDKDGGVTMTIRSMDVETVGTVIGDMRVWTGTSWDPVGSSKPEPPVWTSMKGWDPDSEALLDDLHCDSCGFQMSTQPCGPQHAWIMDNPLEHPLLKPLLEVYLHEMRRDDKTCGTCSGTYGDVKLATGDCKHLDVRGDQVTMSRSTWVKLVCELDEARLKEGSET